MIYAETPIYTLLSIAVVLLGIVFAINYNRNTGLIGLQSSLPFFWFVLASWYSVVVGFIHSFVRLALQDGGLEPVMYVLGALHAIALALFAVSLSSAFSLMSKIAVDDSLDPKF